MKSISRRSIGHSTSKAIAKTTASAMAGYSKGVKRFALATVRTDRLRSPPALIVLLALVVSTPPIIPGEAPRHLAERLPGTPLIVTATEGPGEPRSIGSYALRLYSPYEPELPFDNYVDGAVRPRDGGLADLVFGDLDGDAEVDIVVVVRSAGSGGYISADGFIVSGQRLTLAGHVGGLRPRSDPLGQLQQLARRKVEPR